MTDKELVDWLRNCSIYEGRAFLRQAADRIEALEAKVERLRREDWFEQFEEQEQLRDDAEQRLSVVEAENERLRGALLKICHHSTDAYAHDTAATAIKEKP